MRLYLIVSMFLLVGCGKSSSTGVDGYADMPERKSIAATLSPRSSIETRSDARPERAADGKSEGDASGEIQTASVAMPQSAERKIIYTASLSLIVDNFEVNIDAREERNYQPPQALTLGNRISTAWNNSLEQTSQIFQNTIVFFGRNAIGIIAWIVGLTFAWTVFRIVRRKFQGTPAQEY